MHVTLRQLQIFEALARHESFSRAAAHLHLSQPAVSMQVKQLERSIGLALFEQIGKRIHLTDAGRVMQRCGRDVAERLREAEEAVDELKGIDGGRLRISVTKTVNYFAPRILARFCRTHAGVRLSLDVTSREVLIQQLADNSVDVVLMGKPPAGIDVEARVFMHNPLVVIAPPSHPLARRPCIPLSALRHETFVVREPGSGTRASTDRFFEERQFVPAASIEMNSIEAIKQSVEAGLGIGIVSLHTIQLELDAGRIVTLDVRHCPIHRDWYVVHRRGKRLSAAARAFEATVLAGEEAEPGAA